jgi:hypothetical protein
MANSLAGCHVPYPGRFIIASGKDKSAVWTEGNVIHRTFMDKITHDLPAACDRPESGGLVFAARYNHSAIRAEIGNIHFLTVAKKRTDLLSRRRVP